jgi:hypothetical protein
MTPEQLAQLFHETYERLAPEYGYETRPETAKRWEEIPADNNNKRLMIAVAGEIMKKVVLITPNGGLTFTNAVTTTAIQPTITSI